MAAAASSSLILLAFDLHKFKSRNDFIVWIMAMQEYSPALARYHCILLRFITLPFPTESVHKNQWLCKFRGSMFHSKFIESHPLRFPLLRPQCLALIIQPFPARPKEYGCQVFSSPWFQVQELQVALKSCWKAAPYQY